MRSGYWTAATIAIGVFGVFAFRTLTASKVVHAVEFHGNVVEESTVEEEGDSGYTEREMIEYRHRANMPRHWRHVMIGQ